MFWEVPLAGILTAFLTTDFQLEGLFGLMKWYYFREWAKQDRLFGGTIILFLGSTLIFLLILTPLIGG